MPRSKKGRISGTKRQELNSQRAAAAINGKTDGVTFARVTKMVGQGKVTVAIPYKHGIKELHARIPNVLGRRGATPITVKDVVAIYVGEGYDPDAPAATGEHFDIVAILTQKQAYSLKKDGIIPDWMTNDIDGDNPAEGTVGDGGFEFAHESDEEEDEEKSASDEDLRAKLGANRLAHREPVAEGEINIDDI
jgi:hypothetical protein|uniref:S1-like domain-containing protein n=1 Tax=viral metagenome TaxID=1070528 RepID=A0A6C0LM50_9ZZZZ